MRLFCLALVLGLFFLGVVGCAVFGDFEDGVFFGEFVGLCHDGVVGELGEVFAPALGNGFVYGLYFVVSEA